jgi:hypothetical protein
MLMGMYMKAIGRKIKHMVKECTSILVEPDMKAIGIEKKESKITFKIFF